MSYFVNAAKAIGVTWPLPEGLTQQALEQRLYPDPPQDGRRHKPNYAVVHQELKRKGVTLELLWQEYREEYPDNSYGYTQFCEHYRRFTGTLKLSMRQTHRAGEKLFVDYAGPTVPIINKHDGTYRKAAIFVAVLGASNYTFAEATWSQQLPDWIGSHVRAFEYIGGVTEIIVPDNLKSGVSKACRYEPDLNPTYHHFAEYYNVAIVPARPNKPRDKAKVEKAVQVVERWILARLRRHEFFSLVALNQEISRLLLDLNNRPFKKLPGTRHSQFEQLDKPVLRQLPLEPYQYIELSKARVHIDYHVEVNEHYYSVPYQFVKKQVDAICTSNTVEIFYEGNRIASHIRSYLKNKHTTLTEHMPESHKYQSDWSPERFLSWAKQIGPGCQEVIRQLLNRKQHPEQNYRSCLGVLSLSKQYGDSRLDAACTKAIAIKSPTRKSIISILKHNLDKHALPSMEEQKLSASHENIRGSNYYH